MYESCSFVSTRNNESPSGFFCRADELSVSIKLLFHCREEISNSIFRLEFYSSINFLDAPKNFLKLLHIFLPVVCFMDLFCIFENKTKYNKMCNIKWIAIYVCTHIYVYLFCNVCVMKIADLHPIHTMAIWLLNCNEINRELQGVAKA